MKFRKKTIKGKSDEAITITHLDDTKNCYLMVSQYCEVRGCQLTKTKVKALIKKLQDWVDSKDAESMGTKK